MLKYLLTALLFLSLTVCGVKPEKVQKAQEPEKVEYPIHSLVLIHEKTLWRDNKYPKYLLILGDNTIILVTWYEYNQSEFMIALIAELLDRKDVIKYRVYLPLKKQRST